MIKALLTTGEREEMITHLALHGYLPMLRRHGVSRQLSHVGIADAYSRGWMEAAFGPSRIIEATDFRLDRSDPWKPSTWAAIGDWQLHALYLQVTDD